MSDLCFCENKEKLKTLNENIEMLKKENAKLKSFLDNIWDIASDEDLDNYYAMEELRDYLSTISY